MRVLALIAAPNDLPPLDVAATWNALEQGLGPLRAEGRLILDRLIEPTEVTLKRKLAADPVDVLHFVGYGRAQEAAQYATLSVLAQDGRARKLTLQYVASLLRSHRARLAVLQIGGSGFVVSADIVGEGTLEAVITLGHLSAPAEALFVRRLYGEILGGATLEAAIAEARSALSAGGAVSSELDIGLQCRTPSLRFASEQMVSAIPTLSRGANPAADHAPAVLKQQALLEEVVRGELSRKRLANAFDVFLCYNSSDKAAVKQIAQQLQVRGILPWLDEWELPPGQPWQPLLEQQIAGIKSAAVFVGADGVGPWQEQELYGFLREFTSRRAPVIPVLLLNAPEKPKLPVFLSAMTWVEFRKIDPDPLAQLIWGITGQRVHQ